MPSLTDKGMVTQAVVAASSLLGFTTGNWTVFVLCLEHFGDIFKETNNMADVQLFALTDHQRSLCLRFDEIRDFNWMLLSNKKLIIV